MVNNKSLHKLIYESGQFSVHFWDKNKNNLTLNSFNKYDLNNIFAFVIEQKVVLMDFIYNNQ